MKKIDVRVGETYEAKVSGKLARVKINYECAGGGWMGTNLDSGHSVRVRTAGRLRKPVEIAPPTSNADLWRQWQALKASNPGTVLLFLVGDFFEAYGDDATVCSEALGLAVMIINKSPEVSFPPADLESNIRRLVAAGHRVAVCERVRPGEARQAPRRIVVAPFAGDLLDTVRHKEEITEALIQATKKVVG